MIFDKLINIEKYKNIPNTGLIINFLESNKLKLQQLQEGEIEIRGKDLYVKILRYVPKRAEENNFEIHKIYTDIQIIMDGIENMQITGMDNAQPIGEYNTMEDVQFFSAKENISDIVLRKNEFIVFSQGEAHKPGCIHKDICNSVFKLVFKVRSS